MKKSAGLLGILFSMLFLLNPAWGQGRGVDITHSRTYASFLQLGRYTPPVTTDKLYNVAGNLYWNGVAIPGGGGSTAILLQGATPGSAQTGHGNITGTFIAGAFSGPLTGNVTGNTSGSSGSCTGNAATASDGLSSASGTAPLTLTLAAKGLTGSVAITPTNPGGAVALQAATPGTVQTGSLNVDGTGLFASIGLGTSPSHKLHILDTDTTASRAGLYVSQTGAITGTGYGANINKTGASTTNIALYVAASGATNNYGLQVANGAALIGGTTWPTSVQGLGAGRLCVASTGANAFILFHDDTAVAADTGPGGLAFTGRTNDTGPAYSQLANISAKKENATQGNTKAYLRFYIHDGTTTNKEQFRIDSSGNIFVGGLTVPGTSLAKGMVCGTGTAASAVVVGAQLWAANLNGANTGGFQFMNQAATTVYTMMGCSGVTAASTGTITLKSPSANSADITGYLTTLRDDGTVVYIPYLSAIP